MSKPIKKKRYSPEKMADLYLAELARENNPPPHIHHYLDSLNIYLELNSLRAALTLLQERGYIEKDPDRKEMSGFGYSRDQDPNDLWKGLQTFFPSYKITDEGWRFVNEGQELDENGRAERESERKKWKERAVTAGIALLTSILTMAVKAIFTGE